MWIPLYFSCFEFRICEFISFIILECSWHLFTPLCTLLSLPPMSGNHISYVLSWMILSHRSQDALSFVLSLSSSMFQLMIQMLICSGNNLTKTSRNNVLPLYGHFSTQSSWCISWTSTSPLDPVPHILCLQHRQLWYQMLPLETPWGRPNYLPLPEWTLHSTHLFGWQISTEHLPYASSRGYRNPNKQPRQLHL